MAILKTLWTSINAGRRFMGCANIRSEGGKRQCGFFTWVDPPICARGTVIIPGLLCKLQARNEEVASLQKRLRFMVVVVVLLIFFIFFWLMW
ncbi:DNA-(apurinic or apyrimidinic site) lyase [Handroanthus impetiginosus]|uniref:DNA-(Apurinic or apyrimidinic site) lyase n=1 Tax=Handroanthus impetiginosus TaxID=429701 RepID=A0A2G9HL24_9LAMI|nr:DNA-(apurinic or apyrimidinic site) lyase [Handroanthus impetiginosus]